MRRIAIITLFLCAALAGGACVYYVVDYVGEQRALVAFLDSRLDNVPEGDVVALLDDLTAYMKTLPSDETTARVEYLNPLYPFMRARPIDVLRLGGYCGNKSRLLIALLHLQGIPARLAYIYNPEAVGLGRIRQPYITAFVEVEVDRRWIVVDPFLGFVYRNAGAAPAIAAELAMDPSLIARQAPPWFDPAIYHYRDIRGIRWTKTPAGETLRAALVRLVSEQWVGTLHYPHWVQRPNLVFALLGGISSLLCLAAGLWIRRRPGRARR
jgi:hypothetical protein